MSESSEKSNGLSWPRYLAAIILGFLGGLFVWIGTPYMDAFINCNEYALDMSDGYMPLGVMGFMLFVVLVVNPLLYRFAPQFALRTRQLAVAFAFMLVGGQMGGDGLMRRLPYYVIGASQRANQDKNIATMYERTKFKQELLPEKIGYGLPSPIADKFIDELPPLDKTNPKGPKEPVPWGALKKPALLWGLLFLSAWLMMIGMAQILVPQWRDNERLPFPILYVQQLIIQEPGKEKCIAPLFRNSMFWLIVIAIFVLKTPTYIERMWPGIVPVIPLDWNISACFSEAPYNALPDYVKTGFIFFTIVGISFFMRSRITFSVWFFTLAYAVYEMWIRSYRPPFDSGVVNDHRIGAMIGLAVAVLFLGRKHFLRVIKLLFRKPEDDFERQMKNALLMFLLGCVGSFLWIVWFGLPWGWALFFVALICLVSIIITRLVAETGLPYSQVVLTPSSLLYLTPLSWLTPITATFSSLFTDLISNASIASPAGLASHGLLMDDKATPKNRWNLSILLVIALVCGFIICGGAHVYGNFQYSMTMDGKEAPNPYWYNYLNWALIVDARDIADGKKPTVNYNRPAHLTFGAALAGGLEWASLSNPSWFLHPIGLIVLHSWYINRMWQSIFIGWLLNKLILRYGGNYAYRRAAPIFLAFIVGEVLTMIIWGFVPAVRTLFFK